MLKKAIYVVGGEIEGKWTNKAVKFDLKEFGFKILKDLESTLQMPSLASYEELGIFVAGKNIEEKGEINFYTEEFNKWYRLDEKETKDDAIEYGMADSGFPAMKFFKGASKKENYLLLAGGYDQISQKTSSSVKLYLLDLKCNGLSKSYLANA
jgi:hypothetical protein